jgi:hypothetical protein
MPGIRRGSPLLVCALSFDFMDITCYFRVKARHGEGRDIRDYREDTCSFTGLFD